MSILKSKKVFFWKNSFASQAASFLIDLSLLPGLRIKKKVTFIKINKIIMRTQIDNWITTYELTKQNKHDKAKYEELADKAYTLLLETKENLIKKQ